MKENDPVVVDTPITLEEFLAKGDMRSPVKISSVAAYRKQLLKDVAVERLIEPPASPNYGLFYYKTHSNTIPYLEPEYDLRKVHLFYENESLIERSIIKRLELMFKAGWKITGNKERIVNYINKRITEVCLAGGTTPQLFLRELITNLFKYSNVFLVKIRDKKRSSGTVRKMYGDGKPVEPIAYYQVISPLVMKPTLDKDGGKIVRWTQFDPNGWQIIQSFPVSDVVHMTMNKGTGYIFGKPLILSVIPDVEALRRMEENIQMLVAHHIFPLYQYAVGTEERPAVYYQDGTSEVDIVKQAVISLPTQGVVFTPERHKIEVVSESGSMDALPYIEYFKNRVYLGLGVSSVDMGESNCYDKYTMTLTENGWKYYHQIDHTTEKIGTYNPDTKQIEFHIANYRYVGNHSGNMIALKGKHVDIKVTPEHMMWVGNRGSGDWRLVPAKELLGLKEFLIIDKAENGLLQSKDTSVIDMTTIGNRAYQTKDIMSLGGWFVSEGCLDTYREREKRYRVYIFQKNPVYCLEIRSLLIRMGVSFAEDVCKKNGVHRFIIHGKAMYSFIKMNFGHKAHHKFIGNTVKFMNSGHKEFIVAALHGDGTAGKGLESVWTYYTVSEQLAKDMVEMSLYAGLRAKYTKTNQVGKSLRPGNCGYIYRVFIDLSRKSNSHRILTVNHVQQEQYDDVVYCYNVPNHLFITMRNGKPAIQGNTANRSTAITISQNLKDSVQADQSIFAELFNLHIIRELLLESPFSMNLIDAFQSVYIQFFPVDIDEKIKREIHGMTCYQGGILTINEARAELAREPIGDDKIINETAVGISTKMQAYLTSLGASLTPMKEGETKPKLSSAEEEAVFRKSLTTLRPENSTGAQLDPKKRTN